MKPLTPLAAAAALAMAMAGTPTAAAAPIRTVSPGDHIVTTADAGDQQCTLGYTFTSPNGHAYGITAGHCNTHRSRRVTDRTTGAVGRFVLSVSDPDRPLHDDYGLIDFGPRNRAVPVMFGMPVTGISAPDPDNAVCHDGIRTGVACGALHTRLAGTATQFTTTGMPRSIPGDSGGPVWQLTNRNTATIIGIWLGEHLEPTGKHYGRFTGLTDVLADIANSAGL